ncbi:MAG: hypothetical protein AAF432_07670 [Planctomycetota bacterium]
MSSTQKSSLLQTYNMVLYRTALHPEFFDIQARQRLSQGDYEFEAWLLQSGHAIRFECNGLCVTEIVSSAVDPLPERGLVASLPCAGEKDHECEFGDRVVFMTSIQTETLSDHLYLSTYNELRDHAEDSGALMLDWNHELNRPDMSLLDMQRYNDEVHVQSYHLRAEGGFVLRTQSIFQIKQAEEATAR